ncbi:MAG: hypothetical protein AUJ52_13230 [Elusimicrobia bacterium CG1_02_63_36]|nr:MAG: hypothetical protein AUJ52_13230 [Elusimicrobia bacterium CG1_02_63_36]PIP83346.1 MAG: transcriptional regulator [Elusimicrobia bacterium CG22_combo_CG10-13_8_21_14_all_63_91]PJA17997.1 MAG: ArsR family transcriptional regulator [Elusimicrobia bacterium CG_4_10_14_0_2_um_filter_63_34]PJB24217.1 MAG: ArsR family transcriptional regulator [Elusimicrobia bacterium CG_4_9_14_3_um_filter_62_55]
MLSTLFGNKTAERVLLYLQNYGEGYATQIARTFGAAQSQVQKQLSRLEQGDVLVSVLEGRTRRYRLNPRWPFRKELAVLLERALASLPREEIALRYRRRTRPRRPGKVL